MNGRCCCRATEAAGGESPACGFTVRRPDKCAIVSFNVEGVHPYDMGMILDKLGIAVRTGQHCAEPVMTHYASYGYVPGFVRDV